MSEYFGLYKGIVVDNNDPLGQGRIKAVIPKVFGETTTAWVAPVVPTVIKPAVNSSVYVQFVDGDIANPVYSGTQAISAGQINAGAIDAMSIYGNTIKGAAISGSTITSVGVAYTTTISGGTVTTNNLRATNGSFTGSITGTTITGSTITGATIQTDVSPNPRWVLGTGAYSNYIYGWTGATAETVPGGLNTSVNSGAGSVYMDTVMSGSAVSGGTAPTLTLETVWSNLSNTYVATNLNMRSTNIAATNQDTGANYFQGTSAGLFLGQYAIPGTGGSAPLNGLDWKGSLAGNGSTNSSGQNTYNHHLGTTPGLVLVQARNTYLTCEWVSANSSTFTLEWFLNNAPAVGYNPTIGYLALA